MSFSTSCEHVNTGDHSLPEGYQPQTFERKTFSRSQSQILARKFCTGTFLPLPEARNGASTLRELNEPMAQELKHCLALSRYTNNLIFCQWDKVAKTKGKWKAHLKDGLVHLELSNGMTRDIAFKTTLADLNWSK